MSTGAASTIATCSSSIAIGAISTSSTTCSTTAANGTPVWRVFDMNINGRRPDTWTSADAAGLAILPGLVRYDEVFGSGGDRARVSCDGSGDQRIRVSRVAQGGLDHRRAPHGRAAAAEGHPQHFRDSPPEVQKIFRAMKKYGLIVADNGTDMYVSGTYDTRWNNDVLNPAFRALTANDFEVVTLGYGRQSGRVEPALSMRLSWSLSRN